MKDNLSEFGPEHDYIAAIERTAKEMSTPSGVDTKVLAERAAREYWAARDKAHGQEQYLDDYERRTAELARVVAAGLTPPDPRSGKTFWIEALCALSPGLVFFSVIYLAFRSSESFADPGVRLALKWTIGVTIALCLGIFLAMRYTPLRKSFGPAFNIAGALVGGFASVCLLSVIMFYQAKHTEVLLIDLARREMSNLVILTMERMQRGEEISGTSYEKDNLSLTTEVKSPTEVEYVATFGDNAGLLVAQVGPERGTLYWKYDNGSMIEAEFLLGKVVKEERGGFIMQSSDGPNVWIGINDRSIDKPKIGERVIAVIDTRTSNAIMIREIGF